ncbi:hypothetical protein D3C78_1587110 [compost metagenome]
MEDLTASYNIGLEFNAIYLHTENQYVNSPDQKMLVHYRSVYNDTRFLYPQ